VVEKAKIVIRLLHFPSTPICPIVAEKACKEHIEQNHYHYNNPKDYLVHAFRNPEMETVLEFLCGITGGELHK